VALGSEVKIAFAGLGAMEISRKDYLRLLKTAVGYGRLPEPS